MADTLIPRPYQVQLEEIAVKKNTIIHLPTGSGKTFIAVRLIARFRDALLKPYGQGGKRTFFLVNNVPLVIQQKKVIEQLCPVKNVGGYSSENQVDYWDKEKWDLELTKYQVVVMTSQILADMLTHNYIRIEDINLIIFDECHHAVDDHPMRLVMKNFESCDPSRQPRVLGLTATLINGNVTRNKVEDTLKELETTFHASIATVNELGEVLTYSTNPYEQVIYYQESLPASASKEAIKILEQLIQLILATTLPRVASDYNYKLKPWQKDISTDPKKIVKEVKNMVVAMISFIEELGVYGGALGILAYHVLLERLKRKALSKQESTLYSYTITHSLKARKILLESMKNDTGFDKIVKNSSNKICKLLQILKEYNPEVANSSRALKVNRSRKPISAIIFVQQRFTAKILYNFLKDVKEANPADFGFLKHDFIVGLNINPFKCTREQYFVKKCSEKALLQFCNQDLNCLISTSIIEEGIDIPQCMLVLRYDPPLEYRSYIQSKGRARSAESAYVILISENDLDRWSKVYNNFQIIESYIQKMLTGNTDTREEPSLGEIQKGLYEEDDIPPFVSPNGNRLSSVSAISLLNRYCSVLPHDQFTTISPVWLQEDVTNKHGAKMSIVTIILPIASPVKEPIAGDPMPNLKNAKRSAALKACIKLYEEGELDPDTLLPRQQGVVDFDLTDVKECFPNWHWDDSDDDIEDLPRAGTKKRVRKHKKVFPTYLNGPKLLKDEQQTFGLHLVKLKVEFKMPTNSREKALFDLLQRDEGYGFLTSQPLPKICDFPMFLAVGQVSTSIQMNYAVIKLNKVTFELVKQFHFFLFDQVLDVAKKFLMFDGTVNSMYVVPVKSDGSGGFDINWNVITTPCEIPPVEPLSAHARRSIRVDPDDYRYSVVTPWYRSPIHPGRYIVSNVLEYMTPKSRFDENSYGTYEDYYSSKYGLDIFGKKDQPLLEAINISSRMNCLMPRASTLKEELSEKQQKLIALAQGEENTRSFNENLIPEFCIKYDYPGVLWYKAIMLPSVVHRITMLLTADELRAQIAKDMKYGDIMLKKGENWSPIVNDRKVVVSSMLAEVEAPSAVNTVDRMNNPLSEDGEPRKRNIVSMKESLYRLLKTRINKDYPWDEKAEPIDIERNINTVTLMDVECYDAFVEAPIASVGSSAGSIRSPPLAHPSAAILSAPLQYKDKISLLSKSAAGRGPELRDVLAALTTANSHDGFDMERAETLGDSFLKFIASLYLYHKFPKLSEGQLTNIKGRLIGNRNLYYAGEKACLGGRMKTEHFSPKKDFLVPGFFAPKQIQELIENKQIRPTFLIGMGIPSSEALSGQLSPESWAMVMEKYEESDGSGIEKEPINFIQTGMQCYVRAQAVSDKSVADCIEALVGTYLLSGGMTAAIKVLEWFKVLPPQDNVEQLLRKRVPTPITRGLTTVSEIELILNKYRGDVQEILGYEFKDPSFLLEALSHASYIRNRLTPSYERLEFIGDAILDFLITAYIYENCRDLKPGELTDLRSALVNNVTFAAYVVKLGLHKYICSQLNPVLDKAICVFVEHQQQRNHEILEDVLYLIDERDCQISEYVEVPKVLSDIFESLVGAMYLDSGGDVAAVWRVVYRVMHREINAFSKRIPKQPVRLLYEDIHACPSFGAASMTMTAVPRVMVPVTFTKEGRQHTAYGFGGNKFQAKRAAAKLALKILGA